MLSAAMTVQRGNERLERQQHAAVSVSVRAHRREKRQFRPAGWWTFASETVGDVPAQGFRLRRIEADAVQADQRGSGTAEQALSLIHI